MGHVNRLNEVGNTSLQLPVFYSSNQESFKDCYCPVGGSEVMQKVAEILGFVAEEKEATLAVLKCNGTCENAPAKVFFDGITMCRMADKISVGQTGCPNGCLRLGDCIKVCKFDALKINSQTGLPEVDQEKCTSCQAWV